jgi:hypothetical protein
MRAQPFILRVPKVETRLKPWAESCSACGSLGPYTEHSPRLKVETIENSELNQGADRGGDAREDRIPAASKGGAAES